MTAAGSVTFHSDAQNEGGAGNVGGGTLNGAIGNAIGEGRHRPIDPGVAAATDTTVAATAATAAARTRIVWIIGVAIVTLAVNKGVDAFAGGDGTFKAKTIGYTAVDPNVLCCGAHKGIASVTIDRLGAIIHFVGAVVIGELAVRLFADGANCARLAGGLAACVGGLFEDIFGARGITFGAIGHLFAHLGAGGILKADHLKIVLAGGRIYKGRRGFVILFLCGGGGRSGSLRGGACGLDGRGAQSVRLRAWCGRFARSCGVRDGLFSRFFCRSHCRCFCCRCFCCRCL